MSDTGASAPAAASTPSAQATSTAEPQATDLSAEDISAEEAIAKAAETPEAAKSLKKLFKLKVDGQEMDEEIDLNDEEAIKKHLQMSKVAQKRMNEKAQIEKDMRELVNLLKTTPDAVLTELGINIEDFATNVLNKKLEDMKKSPEQKELEKLRAEAEKERKEKEQLKQEKEQSDMLRSQEKARQEFDNELTAALENDPDLPKNSYVVKRVADLMIFALENKVDVRVKDVIPLVKKEIHGEWAEMFSKMPEENLERVIGKDNINRVRKAALKRQKEANPTNVNNVLSTGASDLKPDDKQKEKQTYTQFMRSLGKK